MKSITRKRINAKKGAVSGGGGGTGTVTNISTTSPILGGPITVAGTISFDESANFTWTGSHNFTVDLPQSAIVPTGASDLTNKAYVDGLIAGLSPQPSVVVATAAALPACTAAGAGVGKTLTMNAVGVLTVDGVATVLGNDILVKDQVAQKDNGIYTVTTEGTAGVAAVLTRRTNYDQTAEVVLGTFFGISGGTQVGTVWVMISPNPVTVDTDPIIFTYFFTGTSYTASQGVQLSGTNFSANLDATGGIVLNGNQLKVNTDGTTIDVSGGNLLEFIGSATDVTNDSLVVGANVADALNTLNGLLSPTFTDVLTNGNSTSLTAIFNDGAGNSTSYEPSQIINVGLPLNLLTNSYGIWDSTLSYPMFNISTLDGSWSIGDSTGWLTTPSIISSGSGQTIILGTSGPSLYLDGISNLFQIGGSTISINGAYTIPVTDGGPGTVLTTDGAGTLSFNTIPNPVLDSTDITNVSTVSGTTVTDALDILLGIATTANTLTEVLNAGNTTTHKAIFQGPGGNETKIDIGGISQTNATFGNTLQYGGITTMTSAADASQITLSGLDGSIICEDGLGSSNIIRPLSSIIGDGGTNSVTITATEGLSIIGTGGIKMGPSFSYAKKFHLTSAQIQTGNSVPIVLVAAAGAGTAVYAWHDTTARCINGVVPATATKMKIQNTSSIFGHILFDLNFLAAATSNPIKGDDGAGTNNDMVVIENEDLVVFFDSDNPAYDGTIDIYLKYEIITL